MADHAVHMTRTFNAPRALAFKAWTDPEMVQHWWGPKYFTNPVCEVDARPGGAIKITMRGPDGTDYPMAGRFDELSPPDRLIFTSWVDRDGERVLEVHTTVTFEEKDGKTLLTMWGVVQKATEAAKPMLAGMEQGWSGSLDKLVNFIHGSI